MHWLSWKFRYGLGIYIWQGSQVLPPVLKSLENLWEPTTGMKKSISVPGQMPSAKFRFTVLTPTYNRAHLLPNVYESLRAQTFRDFEWVIVDDGSTDGTGELIASWRSFFPIRYIWKPNGGKHTAVNVGVHQAVGEFVLIIDSDDRCLPHALERFDIRWKEIADPNRFAFLVSICYQEDGSTILGSRLPADHVDVFTIGDSMALCDADRWGMVRTDVFRQFPYPVFEHEHDILEGVAWNRMLRKYGARYFDEPLRIAGYAPGGLSNYGDRRYPNPKGAVVYYAELAVSPGVPFTIRLKSTINALRFSIVVGIKWLSRISRRDKR